jgi:hypothetical protein
VTIEFVRHSWSQHCVWITFTTYAALLWRVSISYKRCCFPVEPNDRLTSLLTWCKDYSSENQSLNHANLSSNITAARAPVHQAWAGGGFNDWSNYWENISVFVALARTRDERGSLGLNMNPATSMFNRKSFAPCIFATSIHCFNFDQSKLERNPSFVRLITFTTNFLLRGVGYEWVGGMVRWDATLSTAVSLRWVQNR